MSVLNHRVFRVAISRNVSAFAAARNAGAMEFIFTLTGFSDGDRQLLRKAITTSMWT